MTKVYKQKRQGKPVGGVKARVGNLFKKHFLFIFIRVFFASQQQSINQMP